MSARPSWPVWCELVADEVKPGAHADDAALVRRPENLIAWMRALNQIKSDVEARMGDSRLRLGENRPLPGVAPNAAYLQDKRVHDQRHAARVRYLQGVASRIGECRQLMDDHGVYERDGVGYLLSVLVRVEELLELGDVEAALTVARQTLDRLEVAA